MDVESSMWATLALFATIFPLLITGVAAAEAETPRQAVERLLKGVAVMAGLYTVVNSIIFAGGWMMANVGETSSETPYAEAASHFGLESGEEYPLRLGSRISGTSGHVAVGGSLFYVYGEGSWNPATIVSLGFENSDGKSWIIEIPMNRVTFIQKSDANPSVVVHLVGYGYRMGFATTIHPGGCKLNVQFGWWLCEQSQSTVTYSASDEAERVGLAPIVARAFEDDRSSATITLTPEQYDALLKDG